MNQETSAGLAEDLAATREVAMAEAEKPMTISEAIDFAAWLERTPDAVVTGPKLKIAVKTLHAALQSSRCFYNAIQRGNEVFVLVSKDRCAPMAIELWADEAKEHGCPDEKVDGAYRTAARWRAQDESLTRWPD